MTNLYGNSNKGFCLTRHYFFRPWRGGVDSKTNWYRHCNRFGRLWCDTVPTITSQTVCSYVFSTCSTKGNVFLIPLMWYFWKECFWTLFDALKGRVTWRVRAMLPNILETYIQKYSLSAIFLFFLRISKLRHCSVLILKSCIIRSFRAYGYFFLIEPTFWSNDNYIRNTLMS